MNVLFYISSLRCGGAERVASTLLREWVKGGHNITLVTSAPPATDYFAVPAQVSRISLDLTYGAASLPVKVIRNLRRIFVLRKAIRNAAPSIIVSFMDGNNVIAILAALGSRIPIVISERSDPTREGIPWAWTFLRRLTYPRAALLVVQSRMQQEWARSNFPSLKSLVIPNPLGVDPTAGAATSDRIAAVPHGNRPQVILTVGRLAPEKQIDKLIGIFERFSDTQPGWRLQIVGDGSERHVLEKLISASRHGSWIELLGATKDPSSYYSNARIYVMCSRFEGFPNSVIEAMAFGAAPIGFNCAECLSDIIENGFSGIIVQPDDWDGLLKSISEFATDANSQARISLAASRRGRSFSATVVSNQWLQAMSSLGKAI